MMFARTPERRLRWFLDTWDMCDAPWNWRRPLAELLREACAKVALLDVLGPQERDFYSALPPLITIWRGCEAGRKGFVHLGETPRKPLLVSEYSFATSVAEMSLCRHLGLSC